MNEDTDNEIYLSRLEENNYEYQKNRKEIR